MLKQANTKLVEFLISQGGRVSDATNQYGHNALHLLANQCVYTNLVPLLNTVIVSHRTGDFFNTNYSYYFIKSLLADRNSAMQ